MMGFGMGLGLLVMLLFWGGLIFLAVWLVKTLFSGNPNNQPAKHQDENSDASEILAERYARGEINREQYELMKQDIG
jgi:putative membrane protein